MSNKFYITHGHFTIKLIDRSQDFKNKHNNGVNKVQNQFEMRILEPKSNIGLDAASRSHVEDMSTSIEM